jgi:hypothetical protein
MSNFVMRPMPEDKLDNLQGIFARRFEEVKTSRRLDTDTLLDVLKAGYRSRVMDCYVNDVINPTHFVVITKLYTFWDNNPHALVNAIYIDKELRGNSENLDVIFSTIDNYAKIYGMDRVIGAVPVDDDKQPRSLMWEKAGYSPLELSYFKFIS